MMGSSRKTSNSKPIQRLTPAAPSLRSVGPIMSHSRNENAASNTESLPSLLAFTTKLHRRTDLHLARKAWHLTMGLAMVLIYNLTAISRLEAVYLLSTALGVILCIEFIRLKFSAINEASVRYLGIIMRKSEVNRITGVSYYVGAVLITFLIFPKEISSLAVLYLAFGDPSASAIGITWGHLGPRFSNGKSLIGTLGGMIICALLTLVVLWDHPWSTDRLLIISLLGGLAGGLAEHVPLDVDDNFSIPVVSGFVLWFAYILLGL